MGCDGGTIPRRDELVRLKKKPEQKDKNAELAFKWKHCTIKQLPLQSPIVSCSLGKLYSKEAVIEGLLDRSILPESAVHIKTLKDVKSLNLTPNPAYDDAKIEKGDDYSHNKSPYICPVIGLEMNGKYKFCFLWTCGCVMSERALKQVKTTVCHQCQTPFESSDVVIMNAEGDDLNLMIENMQTRKTKNKSNKKSSKKRANADSQQVEEEKDQLDDVMKANKTLNDSKPSSKKIKTEGVMNDSTSCSSIGSTSKNIEPQDPAFKKIKDNYSVAKDPNASEVLKSIFTSHKSAKEQTKAHWVTYNPFYN
ncbi:replication termination factor 2-like [Chelonus insularis]|uniref:replication termination factor 2-like n=1 Tax=Chelonus insularis TaxID=460826 RepID=UPI00158E5C7D|nr:replication termination factor 2-like [Chelonus insularis]